MLWRCDPLLGCYLLLGCAVWKKTKLGKQYLPFLVFRTVLWTCERSGIRDTERFLKLPYLIMKLGHWPQFQKLHKYSHSTEGVEIELIFPLRSAISDIQVDFQNCYIWARKLVTDKRSRNCAHTLFLPHGVEIGLIFPLCERVSEIQADFLNCHIWAWNLAIGHSSRSCTYTVSLPHGVEIKLIFALRTAVSEIRHDIPNCDTEIHIWVWNGNEKKKIVKIQRFWKTDKMLWKYGE